MPTQPGYLDEIPEAEAPPRYLERSIRAANAHFGWVVLATLILLFIYQLYFFDTRFRIWDYMAISGYTALVIGVYLARYNRRRFQQALTRISDRGTLIVTGTTEQFMGRIDSDRRSWPHRGGMVVGALLLIHYLIAYWPVTETPITIVWALLTAVIAYVAGRILGRMVIFGFLGTYIDRSTLRIETQPGHLDGACGLKPLGDFYFYQAGLVAIAAVHLALWSALIPIWTARDYSRWGTVYLVLLGVAILLEVLTFFWPMFSIHKEMTRQKAEHLQDADQLARDIRTKRLELETADDPQRREVLAAQIQTMTARYHAIENMPTWPVDFRTKRRFALSNMALLTPFIGPVVEHSGILGG